MRSSNVAGSTASPGRTSAHKRLRANNTTGPLCFDTDSACGCSMLAEAKTSATAPLVISSLSRPEGPYFVSTFTPLAVSNALATSFRAAPKTAGCVKPHRLLRGDRSSHGEEGRDCKDGRAHHAPGTAALGKKSCWPLIL